MAREGRRFEFGWLEVLGLILTFALGSALCFFLGIFVGKGLQEGDVARDDQTVRLPLGTGAAPGQVALAPAAAAAGAAQHAAAPAGAPHAATPVPVASPADAKHAAAGKPGEAGTALAVRPPAPTSTVAPGATPPVVATPTPVAASGAVATPVPTRTPAPKATPKPTPKPTRTPQPKPTKVPKPTPTPQLRNGLANLKSGWSIQVNAAKDEGTANAVRARLQEKGFNAYVTRVNLQGETWYRVRVGKFPTMEAATSAVSRLKSDPSYSRAFLVND